jgi:DNA polymerase delta subunit 1
VRAAKGAKAWEKAEDPVWALDHALPIDAQHYLDHHLAQPLLRIFEPLMKNPRELLQGEHTRSIALSTPTAAAGGIMRFAKVKKTCLGCKAPLPEVAFSAASKKENGGCGEGDGSDAGSALCKHCAPRRAEIYSRALGAATALEDAFASLWTQCQRCQG